MATPYSIGAGVAVQINSNSTSVKTAVTFNQDSINYPVKFICYKCFKCDGTSVPSSDQSSMTRSKELQLCSLTEYTKGCENNKQICYRFVNIKNKQDRVVLNSVKAARFCGVHRLHTRALHGKPNSLALVRPWFHSNQMPNPVLQ